MGLSGEAPPTMRASLLRCAVAALLSSGISLVEAKGKQCPLGPNIRPVIVIAGFRGSLLFDSSNEFSLEWLDPQDLIPGNGLDAQAALKLPLTWNATDLTQDETAVGPERFPGDEMPGFLLPDGSLPSLLDFVVSVVRDWEAAPAAAGLQLLYTVAYDWRRDFLEQSARVAAMVDTVFETTACKPIIVAHSFGGAVTYAAIARFGAATADKVHGVLYGGTPLQASAAAGFGVFTQGQPDAGDLGDPELLFTYASLFTSIPPPSDTCVNGPPLLTPPSPSSEPPSITECKPGQQRTGITCNSEACGRPADWPEGEPFFLGLDLHNPVTWQALGLGLPTARLLRGEAPEDVLYSLEELEHIGFATAAASIIQSATFGADAVAVAAVHPPAVQLTLHLTDVTVPGEAEPRDFRLGNSVECVPAATFGVPGAVQCETFRPDQLGAGDGLLPSGGTVFFKPELFGDKLQIINSTVPSPFWLGAAAVNPDLEASPHQAILQGRTTAPGEFVDCGEFPVRIDFDTAAGQYPPLEALLCSLVHQGQDEDPGAGEQPSGGYGNYGQEY